MRSMARRLAFSLPPFSNGTEESRQIPLPRQELPPIASLCPDHHHLGDINRFLKGLSAPALASCFITFS